MKPLLLPEQLQILQHALGVDQYGRGRMYRNHFCAGGKDAAICESLVALGYMRVFAPNQSPLPYYNCAVTDDGKKAMLDQSPAPPKLTRSQKRYLEFLSWRESYGGTFREFLRYRAATTLLLLLALPCGGAREAACH